jgi:hypothetical protein
LQVAMHSPGDSDPSGSSLHWPAVVSQLYMTGVGAGVGTGVGAGVGGQVGSVGMVQQSAIASLVPSHLMNVTVAFGNLYTSGPCAWQVVAGRGGLPQSVRRGQSRETSTTTQSLSPTPNA